MSIGKYGKVPVAENSFAVTYLGPFISSIPETERGQAGILNHPTGVAVDPDGDVVTYGAAGLPPGAAIDPPTGLITADLPYHSAGDYRVTLNASDGTLVSTLQFTWTELPTPCNPIANPDSATITPARITPR